MHKVKVIKNAFFQLYDVMIIPTGRCYDVMTDRRNFFWSTSKIDETTYSNIWKIANGFGNGLVIELVVC